MHDIQTTFKDVSRTIVNDWVLVKFASKKLVKLFVGKVTFFDAEPVMLLTRKISKTDVTKKDSETDFSTKFRFPEIQHESAVEMLDIVSILPTPTFTHKGDLYFQVSFIS